MSRPSFSSSPSGPVAWTARIALVLATFAVAAGPNGWLATDLTPTYYDHQRLMMVAGLLALTFLLVASPGLRLATGNSWNIIPFWVRWALLGFFAAGLISAVQAPLSAGAFLEWGVFLLGTVAVLGIAGARRILGKEADTLLFAFLVAEIVIFTGEFLAFFLPTVGIPDVTISWVSPFFHFTNVRFFNQFQTWTLPLLAGAVILAGSYSRFLAALIGLVGGFWWALLFATGSRGAMLAAVLSTLLTLLLLRGRALRWAGAVLALAVVGLTFYALLFYQPSQPESTPGIERAIAQSAVADQGRIGRWAEALQTVKEQPLFGVGPMQLIPSHPHNILLQIASEWGLPATVMASIIAVAGLIGWSIGRRSKWWAGATPSNSHEQAVPPALTASLLAGMGHGMVSGTFVMPVSQAMAILVAGWMLGLHQNRVTTSTSKEPRHSPAWARVPAGVLLAVVAGFAALAPGFGFTLKDLPEGHAVYIEQERGKFNPRFWSQGNQCLPPWPAYEKAPICSGSLDKGGLS